MLANRRFARLDEDLLSFANGLLGFLLADSGGGGSGFFNQFISLGIGLGQDFLALRFGARELGLDFLRIRQALGDALSPLFEHRQNRVIRKPIETEGDDAKADSLGEEMRLIQAELLR